VAKMLTNKYTSSLKIYYIFRQNFAKIFTTQNFYVCKSVGTPCLCSGCLAIPWRR